MLFKWQINMIDPKCGIVCHSTPLRNWSFIGNTKTWQFGWAVSPHLKIWTLSHSCFQANGKLIKVSVASQQDISLTSKDAGDFNDINTHTTTLVRMFHWFLFIMYSLTLTLMNSWPTLTSNLLKHGLNTNHCSTNIQGVINQKCCHIRSFGDWLSVLWFSVGYKHTHTFTAHSLV